MDRYIIWEISDIVRTNLSLECPVTLKALSEAVTKLGGVCEPAANDSMKVEAKIVTSPECNEQYVFTIKYIANKPETRILFSIAHELGHLFLHILQSDGSLKIDVHRLTSSIEEIDANEFAASLLMPCEKFKEKCMEMANSKNQINLSELAEYFNVSIQSATVRGNILGLW